MKKLLVIMLVLAIGCFLLLTGCGNSQNGNDDNLPSDQNPDVDLHKHEFVLVSQTYPNCTEPGMRHYECSCGETKDEAGNPAFGHNFKVTEKLLPTCLDDGLTKYACSCGETKEEAGDPATGHIYVIEVVPPTCLEAGVIKHVCVCGDSYEEEGEPAVGHNYVTQTLDAPTCSSDGFLLEKCTLCKKYNGMHLPATGEHVYEAGVEASRIARCTTPTCSSIRPAKNDGKYVELLKYTFNESTLEEFYNLHAEISAIVEAAEPYNADLHAYDENSELYGQYLILEAKYEELYSVLEYVVSQYQIAQLEYHLTMNSDSGVQALENFEYMTGLRMDLINDFYVFSEPIYSSMYRDYYYYGMTDPEIRAFILERNTVSDPEYKALYDRNEQIKIEFNALSNPATAVETPILYAEFVENNNKMAQLLGYENYLEYAYENIYDRDYSYQEVSAIADYVKEYLAPLFVIYNNRWKSISSSNLTQEEINQYYNQIADSFFSTYASNKTLNDYIDLMEFGEDCKKQISFSDEFNALFSDGNLFSGNYAGAYVTYIYGVNTPIAYFGAGYNTAFTVAHEFGHYMNEKYSNSMYNQSYDLLEMHSQGNEILYLAYLEDYMRVASHDVAETYIMLNMLNAIVVALSVDTFEQAVYTDTYEGTYGEIIMLDGTITYDEYELLFQSILADFGVIGAVNENYWKLVTIHSPCYYVSYSISAISVLQLYPMAQENFDAAKDAYLKLFSYIDIYETDDEYMSTEDVLEYAGLYSFNDEELYKYIYETLK